LKVLATEKGIAPVQHLTWLTGLDLHIWGGGDEDDDEDDGCYYEYEAELDYPECIWSLTSLKAMCLTSGGDHLPDGIGNLKNLESLTLENSDLMVISKSIGNLSRLTYLSFDACRGLGELTESIGNLVALEVLSLYKCHCIFTLPESIGNLKNLKAISVWKGDNFVHLPSSIGKLTSLKRLTVQECALTSYELPESLKDLHDLKIQVDDSDSDDYSDDYSVDY